MVAPPSVVAQVVAYMATVVALWMATSDVRTHVGNGVASRVILGGGVGVGVGVPVAEKCLLIFG